MRVRTRLSLFLYTAGLVLCTVFGWSEDLPHIRYWNIAEGLAESYCRSLAIHPEGSVWINHGDITEMSLFDGYTMQCYPNPGSKLSLKLDRSGSVWSLDETGLKQFLGGRWITYKIENLRFDTPFLPISELQVLVVFPDKLILYEPPTGTMTVLKNAAETSLTGFSDIFISADGAVWITGTQGLAKIHSPGQTFSADAEWRDYRFDESRYTNFRKPTLTVDGKIVMLADAVQNQECALVCFDGFTLHELYSSPEEISVGWWDSDSTIWILKENSISKITQGRERVIRRKGILSSTVYDVKKEDDGVVWLATSHGLVRMAPNLWRTPNAVAHLAENAHTVNESQDGKLWFIGSDSLICFDEEQWKIYPFPAPLAAHRYETDALCFLPDQRMIMNCTKSSVLLIFDPITEQFSTIQHPQGKNMRLINSGEDGAVWIRTYYNSTEEYFLERYDGADFTVLCDFGQSAGTGQIRHLCQTTNGDIWICDLFQIYVYRDGQLRTMGTEQGYNDGGAFYILERSHGRIWIGNRNEIIEYHDDSWNVIQSNMDSIRSMIEARDGSVWVASGNGLYRYRNGTWIGYNEDDGLPSSIVYKVFEDSRGRIWTGTNNGISLYHPEADTDAPKTVINDLENMDEISPSGNVRISFSGIDKWKYTDSQRLFYSYRLDAHPWFPFRSTPHAFFTRLLAGKHRLEVRAMDRNYNVDPTPAIFEFEVLRPWHETRSFWLLTSSGILIIFFLIVIIIRKNLRLDRQVQERTAALLFANRDLENQIEEKVSAETALKQSEAKNSAILNAIPDLMVRISRDGTILDYKLTEDFQFLPHEKVVGQNVYETFSAELGVHLQKAFTMSQSEVFEYTVWNEGRAHEREARIVKSGNDEVLAIIRDITEQKRLEKEVLEIRESERVRIGNELHDDLCQHLTGIALMCKLLEERLEHVAVTEAKDAKKIKDGINQSIGKIRMLAKGLHPVNLVSGGLVHAIEEMVEQTEKMYGILCRFQGHREIRIHQNYKAMHLYRIVQEALTNAAKHAHAKQIWITFAATDSELILAIEDDGIGFDMNAEMTAGMGLRIMQYRAKLISGNLTITSRKMGGTVVRCTCANRPMQETPEKDAIYD